jgi:hypothetical protein
MEQGDPLSSGLGEVDWETAGQRMVRNEVSMLAERWKWHPDDVVRLTVRMRKSYWHRMIEFVEQEKQAIKKK